MRSGTMSLGARWIVPIEGEPIADGRLVIQNGRIAELGRRDGAEVELDLGHSAILPGFINAHTHLELPSLGQPRDPAAGPEDEVAWLGRVIARRLETAAEERGSILEANLDAAIAAGTTMLADITTAGLSWPHVASRPIRAVVFSELVGLRRERAMETSHAAFEWLGSIRPEAMVNACARPGLSPHAPYSTVGWLYERAASAHVPLCTHLAEMPEELQFLETGGGPLRTFLDRLGAWDDDWRPLGPRPADYIRRGDLRQADWLIAHGNYLDESDFWQLRPAAAPGDQRVAVAFCPRTAARFGHAAAHPFRRMLERGVIVCLGTDSLASSPTLSVLDEARFLRRLDPTLDGRLLLTMATLFGAWALRADAVTGSLKPGKSADLAIVALPDRDEADPYALILDSDAPVVGTAFEGEFVHGPIRSA